jgi:hypothetical protein
MRDLEKLFKTVRIISQWEGIDFLIWFLDLAWIALDEMAYMQNTIDGILAETGEASKPMAIVVQTGNSSEQAKKLYLFLKKCVSCELPVYYSFSSASNAISLFFNHSERWLDR